MQTHPDAFRMSSNLPPALAVSACVLSQTVGFRRMFRRREPRTDILVYVYGRPKRYKHTLPSTFSTEQGAAVAWFCGGAVSDCFQSLNTYTVGTHQDTDEFTQAGGATDLDDAFTCCIRTFDLSSGASGDVWMNMQ
ncbi:hypothetical protein A0H81_10316 [Grifola frondosa]|uniref:Uncharacterized protein n=1 Tax=Grifola frondosa TaxID=5627 RepID=A0A1C7M049_GRIFR|nr:hypothetical protein A0H81_10316 [Grifola frondosa]